MNKFKLKPNDQCSCLSGKKYKKCCFINEYNIKQEEELKYLNGQTQSSDKIKFCMNYYKKMFDKHKIIDITDNINLDNYKTYQLRNYTNKTIMLAEKTEKNNDFFIVKSNEINATSDIIFMYKGVYRIIPARDILKYDDDIINIITKRDLGENI